MTTNSSSSAMTDFGDGTAMVDTTNFYYLITSTFNQNASQHYCFVEGVLPPSVADELCPEGPNQYSYNDCVQLCSQMGSTDLGSCPYNLAGCCDCPYLSFKVNQNGSRYDMSGSTQNAGWTSMGWYCLAVWSLLLVLLVYLTITKACDSSSSATFLGKTRHWAFRVARFFGITGMNIMALWVLVYLVGLNALGYQTYFAFTQTQIGLLMHVVGGSIWLISGSLQFIGPLRRRWPKVHRISGWICVVTALLSTLGLLILVMGPHASSLGGTLLSFIFGAYWVTTLALGIQYALLRDINAHRRWFTRHMFLGASVILQRIFNVMTDYWFKNPAYYTGAFYEAACGSPAASEIVVETMNNSTNMLNSDQATYACNGINSLYGSYISMVQFTICLLAAGLFAAELWLWVSGLQHYQQEEGRAEAFLPLASHDQSRPIRILRRVENLEATLADKKEVAKDAFLLRFRLQNENDALLIPQIGHVNIRIKGMTRSRPYSPLHSMERGFISFIVRRVPGGAYSTQLVDMNAGDSILLNGPFAPVPTPLLSDGENKNKKVLIVAAGTGIVPFYSFLETTDVTCHVLIRDKSEECSVALKGLDDSEPSSGRNNITIESIFDREELLNRLDALLVKPGASTKPDDQDAELDSAKEEALKNDEVARRPFDAAFVCGPNAFNVAVKRNILKRSSGLVVFGVGTDDH